MFWNTCSDYALGSGKCFIMDDTSVNEMGNLRLLRKSPKWFFRKSIQIVLKALAYRIMKGSGIRIILRALVFRKMKGLGIQIILKALFC
jgi:hypothetical protein